MMLDFWDPLQPNGNVWFYLFIYPSTLYDVGFLVPNAANYQYVIYTHCWFLLRKHNDVWSFFNHFYHYSDAIMNPMASQITDVSIVYLT